MRHDLISAVFAAGEEDDLVRLLARVDALNAFLATEDGRNLLTAYRRASNIVGIEEKRDKRRYDEAPDRELMAEPAEVELYEALTAARGRIEAALSGRGLRGRDGRRRGAAAAGRPLLRRRSWSTSTIRNAVLTVFGYWVSSARRSGGWPSSA